MSATDRNKPAEPHAPPAAPRVDAERLAAEVADYQIHGRRYRRTLWFAAWLFARVLLWEVVLRRFTGETVVAANRTRRFQHWAREFRVLAADMGGVMIKLGQFISSRVDILPPAVIQELAGLQDEVPTVDFALIRQTLDSDLGPLEQHFAAFEPLPVAAASLGQAHRAQLHNGERVVVKVQRPGIGSLVHTDLKALGVVAGWAMRLPFIARRANVPALLDEFSAILWEELNYSLEADHAEIFGRMFADNLGIYIPRVYREHSTRRVLTLEDVTTIKLSDYARLEEAGIDRTDVARRLIATYLWMVFVERFFHADPHPGNLFVYPLPPEIPAPNGRHADGQPLRGRPFYLIFVDFGMVGRLTPEIAAGLRETLIALATRDARRLVQSYKQLGILLPGADLNRIEAATRAAFDRVWGLNMAELGTMPFSEMTQLGKEFSDLLLALPFQVPQDFLYLARAVGILSGICTGLDPEIDPWHEMQPFVRRLLEENGEARELVGLAPLALKPLDLLRPQTLRALLSGQGLDLLVESGRDLARRTVQLPALADDVLRRADRGELTVKVLPAPEMERQFRRIESAGHQVAGAIVFTGMALSTTLLYLHGDYLLSALGVGLTTLTFLRVLLAGGPR